jgi:hypothetical protein
VVLGGVVVSAGGVVVVTFSTAVVADAVMLEVNVVVSDLPLLQPSIPNNNKIHNIISTPLLFLFIFPYPTLISTRYMPYERLAAEASPVFPIK